MGEAIERIRLEFLGETFTVKGTADKEEVEKTGAFLRERLESLQVRYPSLNAKNLAILASFHLADELLRIRKDYTELIEILDKTGRNPG